MLKFTNSNITTFSHLMVICNARKQRTFVSFIQAFKTWSTGGERQLYTLLFFQSLNSDIGSLSKKHILYDRELELE